MSFLYRMAMTLATQIPICLQQYLTYQQLFRKLYAKRNLSSEIESFCLHTMQLLAQRHGTISLLAWLRCLPLQCLFHALPGNSGCVKHFFTNMWLFAFISFNFRSSFLHPFSLCTQHIIRKFHCTINI